jgi:hypothetical protein
MRVMFLPVAPPPAAAVAAEVAAVVAAGEAELLLHAARLDATRATATTNVSRVVFNFSPRF